MLANTGVNHDNVEDILAVADGAIVGTSLKVDGDTWNQVDPTRVVDMVARVREARATTVGALTVARRDQAVLRDRRPRLGEVLSQVSERRRGATGPMFWCSAAMSAGRRSRRSSGSRRGATPRPSAVTATTSRRGQRWSEVERLITDLGYYPWRAEPGELDQRIKRRHGRRAAARADARNGCEHWMELADERLRPLGKPAFWMLGNDDPPILAQAFEQRAVGHARRGTRARRSTKTTCSCPGAGRIPRRGTASAR